MIRARRAYRAALVLGVVFLWALSLPSASAHGLSFDPRPPVLLLAILALLALIGWSGRRVGAAWRWVLAILFVTLTGLHFAAGWVAQLLDRPLDLYFDLRHVPSLAGLYLDAVGWRGAALLVAAGAGLLLVFVLAVRAVGGIEQAMVRPDTAAWTLAVALFGLALIAVPFGTQGLVNLGTLQTASRQAQSAWRAYAVLHGYDRRYAATLAAPQPALGSLPGLKARDVYLIYVESYGTVALDEPTYRAALTPALESFAAEVKTAGYGLLSSRLLSPTFGGGSWLAHNTIASGVKLDALLNELVLNGTRKGLPRYLAAAGYRTVEVMPGIKKPYPEGAFWGFDAHYYGSELGYGGPEFGWFGIPDQYTLREFASRELRPGHAALFAQIVLVSSHTPFVPVPPYLADWRDVGKFATVPQGAWERIYAAPNWSNLDAPYLESIAYDLKTLGAWLSRLDGSPLVIILGDHQPPDLTRGAGEAWTVPIYVLSRDPDLLRPFAALGYGEGPAPAPRAHPEGMERFLGDFLAAFSAEEPASEPEQTPGAQAASQP
ncbi:MAG TPA: hypothetical protein VN766_10115 [Stellaceae bacterium]|jgi:hypothetical protein|nr:hypothetical protein [Stellaceae bacterium]